LGRFPKGQIEKKKKPKRGGDILGAGSAVERGILRTTRGGVVKTNRGEEKRFRIKRSGGKGKNGQWKN